jgi:hypothetical protein
MAGRWQGRLKPFAVTVPATPVGTSSPVIAGPVRLVGWSLTGGAGAPTTDMAAAAFAAAAAGNVSLPNATDSLIGFTVSMAATAAVVSGTVTVTHVATGTLTYDFVANTTQGGLLTVTFPVPLKSDGTAPNVAISAIAGGAAGHINVYGQTQGTLAVAATIYDGAQVAAVTNPVANGTDTQWLTDDGITIATGLTVTSTRGTVSGCLYVVDERRPDG